MIALHRGETIVVRCRRKEFAPEPLNQDGKDALFCDLARWNMSSPDIASAIGATPDRVRAWKTRPHRIPDLYWRALVALHIAAEEAVKKLQDEKKPRAEGEARG